MSRSKLLPVCLIVFASLPAIGIAGFSPDARAQSASTQSGQEPPPVLQPWTVNCAANAGESALSCSMQQALRVKTSGQLVISATVFYDLNKQLQFRTNLPHGIMLPAGVSIKVDEGTPVQSAIQIADQNGSYATLPVSDAMLVAMKRGALLTITAQAQNGEPIEFQLSLKGFSDAFARL